MRDSLLIIFIFSREGDFTLQDTPDNNKRKTRRKYPKKFSFILLVLLL
jgi:hypothetical protein